MVSTPISRSASAIISATCLLSDIFSVPLMRLFPAYPQFPRNHPHPCRVSQSLDISEQRPNRPYLFIHGICQQFIGYWNMHCAHRTVTKPSLYALWDP